MKAMILAAGAGTRVRPPHSPRRETAFHVVATISLEYKRQLLNARHIIDSSWACRAICNTARVGFFSSDRAIAEYARDIWHVEAV